MMGLALRWSFVVFVAAGLGGCLDMEKVVHVRADGSGFVEERMLMKRDALAMMQGMAKMASQPGSESGFQLLDRGRLAEEAAGMGPGVTLTSAEALSMPEGEGYVARFAFTDVNQLTLDQNPNQPESGNAAQGGAPGKPAEGKAETPAGLSGRDPGPRKEAIRFDFRSGHEPELIIRSPREDKAPQGEAAAAEAAPDPLPEGPEGQMALQMMQQMFKGMHVAVHVEVEGDIVETNAVFREGPRVTLMDIRFDQILADPQRFKRLAMAQPEGLEQVKTLLKDLPGVEVELNDPVRIRFAPH
jgi:hypothetical protein